MDEQSRKNLESLMTQLSDLRFEQIANILDPLIAVNRAQAESMTFLLEVLLEMPEFREKFMAKTKVMEAAKKKKGVLH